MWACTTDEVKQLAKSAIREHGIRLVSRQQYEQLGSKLVHGLLKPVAEQQAKLVMAAYFPEAEIVVSCAVYRFSICRVLCPVMLATSIGFSPFSNRRLVASCRRS